MGKVVTNKHQDRMLKEAVIAYFKVFSQHFSGEIEESQNTPL
jgi:hypothetical protein